MTHPHHDHDHTQHVCMGSLMESPNVAVLGLGLMGASIASAFRQSDAVKHVVGYDPNDAHVAFCQREKYVHAIAQEAAHAVEMSDIVVLAAPIAALPELVKQIAPSLREGTVITDIASVKASVVEQIAPLLPEGVHYVPAHPIAGRATSGPESADAAMFQNKLVVLTPERSKTASHAIAAVARVWESVGARVERMSPQNHDVIYAYVSHLPQMMAYASARTLAETALPAPENRPDTFRRFTRIGASDPQLWCDIALANRDALTHAVEHVLATVAHMQQEFSDGIAKGEVSIDSPDVGVRFFPMLATSALVSAVSQFEIQNNIRLAPYAGSGFIDFTAPAGDEDPAGLLEKISASHAQVNACLGRFRQHLETIHYALKSNDRVTLLATLKAAQDAHLKALTAPAGTA